MSDNAEWPQGCLQAAPHYTPMSTIPQPAGKPYDPPPAYSVLPNQPAAPPLDQAASGSSASSNGPAPFGAFPAHAHAGYYGPTPIAQQAQLLPYYDPRSPHAVQEATSRARWRFVFAAIWAVFIISVVSAATGWEVERARMSRMEKGWYAFK